MRDVLSGMAGDDLINGNEGSDTVWGGDGNDKVWLGTGDDSVWGEAGNDVLVGGWGNDFLNGGTGSDTYQFNRGDGMDLLLESSASSSEVDTLQLTSGIGREQVWWRRSGSDLEMSLIGSTDKVTIQNWYAGKAFHVEQFRTADGKVLLDTQVDLLVNAMARFAPPAAGQTTLPTTYQTALNTVIAANWK